MIGSQETQCYKKTVEGLIELTVHVEVDLIVRRACIHLQPSGCDPRMYRVHVESKADIQVIATLPTYPREHKSQSAYSQRYAGISIPRLSASIKREAGNTVRKPHDPSPAAILTAHMVIPSLTFVIVHCPSV